MNQQSTSKPILTGSSQRSSEPRKQGHKDSLGLTEIEGRVMGGICSGLTNKEIGAKLFISEQTVKSHLKTIYLKLQARNRAHCVAIYLRRSLG